MNYGTYRIHWVCVNLIKLPVGWLYNYWTTDTCWMTPGLFIFKELPVGTAVHSNRITCDTTICLFIVNELPMRYLYIGWMTLDLSIVSELHLPVERHLTCICSQWTTCICVMTLDLYIFNELHVPVGWHLTCIE